MVSGFLQTFDEPRLNEQIPNVTLEISGSGSSADQWLILERTDSFTDSVIWFIWVY